MELDGKAEELGLAVVFDWGWYGFCGIVGDSIELRGWERDWEPGAWFEARIWSVELDVEAAELGLAIVFGWGWYGFCGIVGESIELLGDGLGAGGFV